MCFLVPDLRKFDGEMAEEDKRSALPLLLCGRNLVLSKVSHMQPEFHIVLLSVTYSLNLPASEVWDKVDDDPGKRAAKVDGFVEDEAHDACREDIILHVGVPCKP